MVVTGRALEGILIAACGSAQLLFGYDQGVLSGLIGLDEFLSIFGYPDENLLGFIVSLYALGCFFGCGLAFVVGDPLGRRWTLVSGSLLIIVGALLQATAYSVPHMVVARIVSGLGTGLNTVTVPILQSELAHASRRGMLVIAEAAVIIFGIILANWIDYGFVFGSVTGQIRWRVPVALQAIFPILVLCLLPLIPESPRWLASKGRYDEVGAVMAIVQGGGATPQDSEIVLASEDIICTAKHEAQISAGWRDIFQMGETQNFRRLLLGGGGQFIQQWSGINILTYYAPSIYRNSLNLDARLAQILAGCGAIIFFIGSVLTIWIIDRLGRRTTLLLGVSGCCVFMIVLCAATAVVETQPENQVAAGWGATAAIFLFYFFFGLCLNGPPWLYAPEINSLRMRNKGSAFSTCNNWLWNFVIVQISPIGTTNLGYKYWIIYAVMNLVFIPTVYFFYPETAGRTLEDIDRVLAANQGWFVTAELRKKGKLAGADGDLLDGGEKGGMRHREDAKGGSVRHRKDLDSPDDRSSL